MSDSIQYGRFDTWGELFLVREDRNEETSGVPVVPKVQRRVATFLTDKCWKHLNTKQTPRW